MFKASLLRLLGPAVAVLLIAGLSLAADSTSVKDKLSKADSDFIKEAAQGGLLEVQLGKVAQDKAASEKVKEFGKRMEQDHGKANDELKKLASAKGIQLPAELDKKHQATVDRLSKLSGAEFDQKYMQDMVSDHKEDIKKFQRQSEKGTDADVKKFAAQTLPTLKQHLQLAESTEQGVKSSKK